MANDEIEAVARAICFADGIHPDANVHTTVDCWQEYIPHAKAALAAMRPVNQEMLEALKEIEQLDSLEGYKASRIAKQAILSAESGNSKNVVVGAYTYRFEPDKPAWGIFYPDGTCYGDTRSEKDAAEWCGELNRRLAESGKGEK
jgi:hypothetical protein